MEQALAPAGSRELDPVTQFRELYESEHASVYRTVYAIVLDRGEAEDLAQETFVRAYRARYRYQPKAPPGAWLRRIAVNLAISHVRRRNLARLLPVRIYSPPDSREYDEADARSVVERALADLSPKLRAAVALHFYEGYTREEVAALLGIPPGTVASRIAKALSVMRQRMQRSDRIPAPARSLG
jgi:RNA polymerase sigma-70 factor, ECF subfamily